jgi:hypothetical protein
MTNFMIIEISSYEASFENVILVILSDTIFPVVLIIMIQSRAQLSFFLTFCKIPAIWTNS